MASGNAVKGASTRPVLYPHQVITMLSEEARDYIEGMAVDENTSKSAAVRQLIDAGIDARNAQPAKGGIVVDDI